MRIAVKDRDVDSCVPQTLQVAHVILVGIGYEEVVKSRPTHTITDVNARSPVRCIARVNHGKTAKRAILAVGQGCACTMLDIPDAKTHFSWH
jgi:hypothetical protein